MIFGISEKLERKYGKYREWLQEQIIKIRNKKKVETFIKYRDHADLNEYWK